MGLWIAPERRQAPLLARAGPASNGHAMPSGKWFAEELRQTLQLRQIARGAALLDDAEADLANLSPALPGAANLLFLVAQWVDAGYRDHRILQPLLQRFPPLCRKNLSIDGYLRLRMTEAFCALAVGNADPAIEAPDFVLKTERDVCDDALAAVAHFWKGRAHRKKGEYAAALEDIARARELAQKSGDDRFTAVIQIQESWLMFQKGAPRDALRLLDHAEAVLQSTDHFVALGNIESARGRIVRRAGEYHQSLKHFSRAIEIYARGAPQHRNMARALVNAAHVRRLLALQIQKRIDSVARSGQAHGPNLAKPSPAGREALRVRYQQLSQEAIGDLHRAREIYAVHALPDGIGNVVLNLGYLHLDRGDIDHAAVEAAEAHRIGVEQNDQILTARARVLEAAIENAHVEEQTGEDVDIAVHADRARQYSEEALALAHHTQNRRLLAAASIARGMTAANEFFQEWELARRCAGEATEFIGPGEHDHLVEDLAALKSKIVQSSGINDALRAWSEGMVGDKTFQQISEEFAEIVIPKVWRRLDRKVSRVAERLSISPKKVRRILRNAGSEMPGSLKTNARIRG